MADRQITIGELFTDAEIERARKVYLTSPPGTFAKRVVEEVVKAAMPRIDRITGQENDATYFGYALELAFMQSGLEPGSEDAPAPPGR